MFARLSRVVSVLVCIPLFTTPFTADSAERNDPDLLWVGQSGQLTAFSLKSGEARVQVEVSGGVRRIATDSSNGDVWLITDDGVSILNAQGERIAGPAVLPHPEDTSQLLIDGQHRVAWMVSGDRVTRWNADTLTPLDAFADGMIVDAAIDEESGTLYVLADGEGGV